MMTRCCSLLWILPFVVALCACTPQSSRTEPIEQLRSMLAAQGIESLAEVQPTSQATLELGRMLFFDPILSGNRDVACATCHDPVHAAGDGRSLAVGTASILVDEVRLPGPDHRFIARNAPPLFNRSSELVSALFWDSRLERLPDGALVIYDHGYNDTEVIRTEIPAEAQSLLAALVLFPVMDRDEMRGNPDELDIFGHINELAAFPDRDFHEVWAGLMARIVAEPGYAPLLEAAWPERDLSEVQFVAAANAIADFIAVTFNTSSSPFDRFLAGDDSALSDAALQGALLFYGDAQCSTCHSGPLLSDQQRYNLGIRPIGRGPTNDVHVDQGAAHGSHAGQLERFFFRTPMLRNVARTGPWMHNGLYTRLEQAVVHHLVPRAALLDFDDADLEPAIQEQVHRNPAVLAEVEAGISPELETLPATLSPTQLSQLLAFLNALTDPKLDELSATRPTSVPSGLPMSDP